MCLAHPGDSCIIELSLHASPHACTYHTVGTIRRLAPVPTSLAMHNITSTQDWVETTLYLAGPWVGNAKTSVLHPATMYSHTSTVPTQWHLGELESTCRLSLVSAVALHSAGAYTVSLACAVALLGAGVHTSALQLCLCTMPCRVRTQPTGAALPALAAPRPVAYEAAEHVLTPGPEAEEPTWACPAHGREVPSRPWADHLVHTLVRNGHLPQR